MPITCYFCMGRILENDPDPEYHCGDCNRWACNTEQCGCLCERTQSELFDIFTEGGPSAEEVVSEGLKQFKVQVWDLILNSEDLSLKVLTQPWSDRIAESVYSEAQRIEKEG